MSTKKKNKQFAPTFLGLFGSSVKELFHPKSKNKLLDYAQLTFIDVCLFKSYSKKLALFSLFLTIFAELMLSLLISVSIYAYSFNSQSSTLSKVNNRLVMEQKSLRVNRVLGSSVKKSSASAISNVNCSFNVNNTFYSSDTNYVVGDNKNLVVCANFKNAGNVKNANWYMIGQKSTINISTKNIDDNNNKCVLLENIKNDSALVLSAYDSKVNSINSCRLNLK